MKIKMLDIRDKQFKEIELDFDTIIKEGYPVGIIPMDIIDIEGGFNEKYDTLLNMSS